MSSQGLQTIINFADSLTINRRKTVGVQYTRSEIAKVGETPTRNPWRFTVGISAGIQYSQNDDKINVRNLLEEIDYYDKRFPQVISFGGSSASKGLSYMFAYNGSLTSTQISQLTVSSFSGNQLVLNTASVIGIANSSLIAFKKGDIIQIGSQTPGDSNFYPFPFTVTQDVAIGTIGLGSTITVATHRPNFIQTSLANLPITVGNSVQFQVFCNNMPTYKLTPGGANALITFSTPFELYEWTGSLPNQTGTWSYA